MIRYHFVAIDKFAQLNEIWNQGRQSVPKREGGGGEAGGRDEWGGG